MAYQDQDMFPTCKETYLPLKVPKDLNKFLSDVLISKFIPGLNLDHKMYYLLQSETIDMDKFKRFLKEIYPCKEEMLEDWDRVAKRHQNMRLYNKNEDRCLGYCWENTFLVKSLFTFGQRTVQRDHVHLIETDKVPILYYVAGNYKTITTGGGLLIPSECSQYKKIKLSANSKYIIGPGTIYVLITYQKSIFSLNVVPKALTQMIENLNDFKNPEKEFEAKSQMRAVMNNEQMISRNTPSSFKRSPFLLQSGPALPSQLSSHSPQNSSFVSMPQSSSSHATLQPTCSSSSYQSEESSFSTNYYFPDRSSNNSRHTIVISTCYTPVIPPSSTLDHPSTNNINLSWMTFNGKTLPVNEYGDYSGEVTRTNPVVNSLPVTEPTPARNLLQQKKVLLREICKIEQQQEEIVNQIQEYQLRIQWQQNQH